MSRKDDIKNLETEIRSLKAKLIESEKGKKALAVQIDQLRKEKALLEQARDTATKASSGEYDGLKKKLITINKDAGELMKSKNAEIEQLRGKIAELEQLKVKAAREMAARVEAAREEFVLSSESGDISLPSDAVVKGGVKSGGAVTVGAGGSVSGQIRAESLVTLEEGAKVRGDVHGAEVRCGAKVEVSGSIVARGDLSIGDWNAVGAVQAGGRASIGKNSKVGQIDCGGELSVSDGVKVEGGISYVHAVTIGKGVMISGSLSAKEDSAANVPATSAEPPAEPQTRESRVSALRAASEQPSQEPHRKRTICSICGTVNKPDARWCTTCGETFRPKDGQPAATRATGKLTLKAIERK